jgi:hypothetical protein
VTQKAILIDDYTYDDSLLYYPDYTTDNNRTFCAKFETWDVKTTIQLFSIQKEGRKHSVHGRFVPHGTRHRLPSRNARVNK